MVRTDAKRPSPWDEIPQEDIDETLEAIRTEPKDSLRPLSEFVAKVRAQIAAGHPEAHRIKQGGMVVAQAEGSNSFAEIGHYARVYSSEGPLTVEYRKGGRWKPLYSITP